MHRLDLLVEPDRGRGRRRRRGAGPPSLPKPSPHARFPEREREREREKRSASAVHYPSVCMTCSSTCTCAVLQTAAGVRSRCGGAQAHRHRHRRRQPVGFGRALELEGAGPIELRCAPRLGGGPRLRTVSIPIADMFEPPRGLFVGKAAGGGDKRWFGSFEMVPIEHRADWKDDETGAGRQRRWCCRLCCCRWWCGERWRSSGGAAVAAAGALLAAARWFQCWCWCYRRRCQRHHGYFDVQASGSKAKGWSVIPCFLRHFLPSPATGSSGWPASCGTASAASRPISTPADSSWLSLSAAPAPAPPSHVRAQHATLPLEEPSSYG